MPGSADPPLRGQGRDHADRPGPPFTSRIAPFPEILIARALLLSY
jgi:hypothetical protein